MTDAHSLVIGRFRTRLALSGLREDGPPLARGWRVVRICVSEFHRGDGALSCLSLRQPPEGGWSV